MLARDLADVVGRDRRRVRKRFIKSGDDRIENVIQAGLDDGGVMLRVVTIRRQRGGGELVMRGVIEADGRSHRRLPKRFGHVGHDKTRIDSSRQERADRHFAFEALRRRPPISAYRCRPAARPADACRYRSARRPSTCGWIRVRRRAAITWPGSSFRTWR